MKTYLQTHPWITFELDLRNMSYQTWLLLGEAQSKCNHIAGVPLLPEIASHLHRVFLAKGALATTAIEGNTLTENEVLKRLDGKLDLPPSREYLGQEIDNIIKACNDIGNRIFSGEPTTLDVNDLKNFNKAVLHNLPLKVDVVPGVIRDYSVGVGNYRGAPAEDCEYLLEELCKWLNSDFGDSEQYKIAFGILKAIVAHIYLAWIHPFGDGNGRTARLVEFQILLSVGVPSTAAQLLSNHYNQTRSEYYRQLEITSKSGGDVLQFIQYAIQGFVDGLQEQIELIKAQQLHVHWVNFVHDTFRNKDSVTGIRRRRLVLDLTAKAEPIPISEIRHISPRIAESYAGKTIKTVQRDVNALVKMGLLEKKPKGFRAKMELVLAFLPGVRPEIQS